MTGISTIDDMSRVVHACLVPDSEDHLWEATAAAWRAGSPRASSVVYFENDTADALLARLADDRVPVAARSRRASWSSCRPSRRPGLHVPRRRHRRAACGCRSTTSERRRVAGDPAGGESTGMLPIGGLRKVVEYEAAVDILLAAHPNARMLCRFDRRFFDEEAVAAMREVHPAELVTPALYDDTLLRVTGSWATGLRFAGEIDLSNRPQVRRVLETALDTALRSHHAPPTSRSTSSSLRFIDVAGAVELVHAAESFPETHRLVLVGARPRVHRVLDRCGAPFAAQPRGAPARGGPVRITSTSGGHPAAPRRGVLRRGDRADDPAPRGGDGRAGGGRAGGAGAAADHGERRCAASRRATCPTRSSWPAPTGRTARPGQTLAARWARELRTLAASSDGRSSSSPSTGAPSTAPTAASGPSSTRRPTSPSPTFPWR